MRCNVYVVYKLQINPCKNYFLDIAYIAVKREAIFIVPTTIIGGVTSVVLLTTTYKTKEVIK